MTNNSAWEIVPHVSAGAVMLGSTLADVRQALGEYERVSTSEKGLRGTIRFAGFGSCSVHLYNNSVYKISVFADSSYQKVLLSGCDHGTLCSSLESIEDWVDVVADSERLTAMGLDIEMLFAEQEDVDDSSIRSTQGSVPGPEGVVVVVQVSIDGYCEQLAGRKEAKPQTLSALVALEEEWVLAMMTRPPSGSPYEVEWREEQARLEGEIDSLSRTWVVPNK